jgi:uncharacterized protein
MKNLITILLLGIATSSCSSPNQQARANLKSMRPEFYYSNRNEIEFINFLDKKDFQKADGLLADGIQVNVIGHEEMTPLAWTFSKQNLAAFRYLLEKGANPNFQTKKAAWNDDGHSVMEFAALSENPEYLTLALQHGGNPNAPDSLMGRTIIFTAIDNKRNENIKILAKYGGDLNRVGKAGFTPMMHCVTSTKYDLALLILSLGASPYIKDRQGKHVGDIITLFGDRGIKVLGKQREQGAFYDQFVDELKNRGLIKMDTKIHF